MDKDKLLKILIIIIAIIFFLLGVYSIYKFIIINKIYNKMAEYVALENFSMKVIDSENSSGSIEMYYKDGIGKMIVKENTYTWTDGEEAYLIDEENKKAQKLSFESSLLVSNEAVGSMIPGYSKNLIERFFLAGNISTSVRIKNYEGIKYYVITTNEEETKTIWFKYDSLLPSQASIEIGDIKKTYNYNITFEKLRDEDVKKPSLEEYEILEKE